MNPPVTLPDAGAVSAAADALASCLSALDDALLEIRTAWSALSAVYTAPEAEIAYAALAPLSGESDELRSDLATAAAALSAYAERLSALATRRAALVADIGRVADPGAAPAPGEPTRADVLADRAAFDADVADADEECARSLRALREHGLWNVADTLDPITGTPGGVAQGLSSELLQRYRGTLLTPGAGAVLPEELILTADAIQPTWPRDVIDGRVWVQNPSGMWMLESNLLPDAAPSVARPPGWTAHPQFTPTPEVGKPPAWAGVGGKALGVAGAGLTYWGVYSNSYNDTLTRHPEWSEDQRRQEALVDSAVVGTTSVAAGAGGAWGGAAVGAGIGSVFPGPGTLIGGIVGGIVGGVFGGWAGQEAAQSAVDEIRGDTDEMIMAPGPLGVTEESEEPVL